MLALGAVIMLCAVAIIGAGYAAFSNTATARTYNEGNNATAGYMTLTPGTTAAGDWSAISADAKAEYSSYKYQHESTTNVAYYVAGGAVIDTEGSAANGYYVKELGTAKTFTLENQTGASISQITFGAKAKIGTDGAVGNNADYKYFLKVANGSNVLYLAVDETEEKTGTLALTAIADNASGEITVQLCTGYVVNCFLPEDRIGDVSTAATAPEGYDQAAHYSATLAPQDMKNISFAFSVLDTTV